MVLADLGSTKTAEIAFGLVGAGTLIGEREAVVDALRLVMGVQDIPGRRLVGLDRRAALVDVVYHVGGIVLLVDHERQGAPLALTHHQDATALA